jgi:hypothetical protein
LVAVITDANSELRRLMQIGQDDPPYAESRFAPRLRGAFARFGATATARYAFHLGKNENQGLQRAK